MRFLCPGCKSPVEVPGGSNQFQAVRPPAGYTAPAGSGPAADVSKGSFGKRMTAEMLAIVGATFRQTLKPITLAFEITRRRRLRKSFAKAQFALGQRMSEAGVGDKNVRARIKALGERIQNIQDVKGDARQPIAERKELITKLAEPALATEKVPEVIAGEHERARTLQAKLKVQEAALAGAFGGLMPPNGLTWRRVILGYTMSLVLALGTFLIIHKLGEPARLAKQREEQERLARQDEDERAQKENAIWATEKKRKEIYKLCAPSVAKISFKVGKKEGGGTGFMIRPGVIMTNAHVVEDALPEDLKVFFPSAEEIKKTPFSCRILYFDRKRDLAMLAVDTKVPALRLADNFKFEGGTEITIIGCPGFGEKLLDNTVTAGTLSTETEVNAQFGKMPFYQLGASVNPGNSGGPVFDSRGQVIGVVTLKATQQEGLSFCIPWKDVKERLDEIEKQDPHQSAAASQSTHRLHVVVSRVGDCAGGYFAAAAIYIGAMQQAARARRTPQEGINQARGTVDDILKQIEKLMDTKYRGVATKLLDDPKVPDNVRGKFRDLWKTYMDVKELAEKPDPNVNAYVGKWRDLVGRYRTQIQDLAKSMGFDPPKIEENQDG